MSLSDVGATSIVPINLNRSASLKFICFIIVFSFCAVDFKYLFVLHVCVFFHRKLISATNLLCPLTLPLRGVDASLWYVCTA